MICGRCGTQCRAGARFCRHCGAPLEKRPEREEPPQRVTVVLPRPQIEPRDSQSFVETELEWDENVQSAIMPISDQADDPSRLSEVLLEGAWRQETPARQTNPEPDRDERFDSLESEDVDYFLKTEALQRESAAKPFFTRVLNPGLNRQHHRLAMIVPLLLLVVILLFIFAYIAAK